MKANQLAEKIFKNWPVKLICFVLAILLYVFHRSAMVEKRSFVLPLEVVQDGIVMPVGNYPKNVTVIVRANTEEITSVHASQITAYVNINNISKSGEYTLPVNVSITDELMRYDPFEIKVKPETIKLDVEKKSKKFVQIKPSIVGEPEHGYFVSDISVEPSYITMSGPESLLAEIEELKTDAIDIEKMTSNLVLETECMALNKVIQVDNEGPYEVTVKIEPKLMEKTFDNLRIQAISLPEGFELVSTLPTTGIILQGIMPMLENFNLNAYSVQVDLSSIKDAGTFELPVRYIYPSYFKLVRKNVDKVKVEVRKIEKIENTDEETPQE